MYKNSRSTVLLPLVVAAAVALGIFLGQFLGRSSAESDIKGILRSLALPQNKVSQTLSLIETQYVDSVAIDSLVERALLDADRGLVDDFVRYAARKGVAPRYGDIARSRQLMEAQLKAYIGRNTSLEDSGYFLSIYPEDEVIVRAIGELEHPTIPTVKAAEAVAEGEPAEEQPAEE